MSPQLPSSSVVLKRHLVADSSGDGSHEHSLVALTLEFLIQWLWEAHPGDAAPCCAANYHVPSRGSGCQGTTQQRTTALFKFCKKEYSFLRKSASICRLLCLGRTEYIEKSTRLFVIKCGHLLGPTALKSAHGLVGEGGLLSWSSGHFTSASVLCCAHLHSKD